MIGSSECQSTEKTVKKAEKLLKQGKVADAIGEYVRLVEDKPSDWNSANTLGDLYLKLGQEERAAEQFTRAADTCTGEGFFPRAALSTRRCSKSGAPTTTPSGSWQTSQDEIVSRSMRWHYSRLIQDRRGAGNEQGEVDCLIRLGLLGDATIDARRVGAKALADRGESTQAARLILGVADMLSKEGRLAEAVEA